MCDVWFNVWFNMWFASRHLRKGRTRCWKERGGRHKRIYNNINSVWIEIQQNCKIFILSATVGN